MTQKNQQLAVFFSRARLRAYTRGLFCSVTASVFALQPVLVYANPIDGTVSAGAATITESGSKLDVNQTSSRVVIDWRSFDIAPGEHTEFHQPSSSAIALNRIGSGNASQILGKLSANGNVVLINPNGVLFGQGSVVDVNGLVATTANTTNAKFMAGGNLELNQPGNPNASIINNGTITAKEAGLVGLVAPTVVNNGTINARLGRVHLASGDQATVDLYGDRLMEVAVSDDVTSQVVENSGTINAAGGQIALTSAAGRHIVDSLISVKGELNAPAVAEKNGSIYIYAEGSHAVKDNVVASQGTKTGTSKVVVAGTLDVSGNHGGTVDVLGDDVTLKSGSTIKASGAMGGGTVQIGGAYQGLGTTPASLSTTVESGAQILARALDTGTGGTVINWSDGDTLFRGTIDVQGGASSGNGGFAEVSGARHLVYDGFVDARAANGETGMLLLDPTNITISNAASSNTSGTTTVTPNADDVTSNLNVATLVAQLASASVTVTTRATGAQLGDLTVVDAITAGASTTTTLSLTSAHDIIINAPITVRNLTLNVGNDLAINSAIATSSAGNGTLTIQPNSGTSTIGINNAFGTLNLSSADLANIGTWNSVIIGNSTTSYTGTMQVAATSWANGTTLRSPAGLIQIDGTQTVANSKNFTLTSRYLTLNAGINGAGGVLTIAPTGGTAYNMGIGTGATSTDLYLDDTELGLLGSGWAVYGFGSLTNTGTLEAMAHSWATATNMQAGAGTVLISGNQTMASGKALSLTGRYMTLNGDLSGNNTLTIATPSSNSYTMGVGTGATGDLNLDDTELAHIRDGWNLLTLGSSSTTGQVEFVAHTWTDAVTMQSGTGALKISGTQNMGINTLTLKSDNFLINGDLIGTGSATVTTTTSTKSLAIGDGATGNVAVSNAMLDRIIQGWNQVSYGTTSLDGDVNVAGNYTFRDYSLFRNRAANINVSGLTMRSGQNVLFSTDRELVFSGAVNGTGQMQFYNTTSLSSNPLNVGSVSGTSFSISAASMANIGGDWSNIRIGSSGQLGDINFAALNWRAPTGSYTAITAATNTANINFNGIQNLGLNTLTADAISGNINLNSTITSTKSNSSGALSFSSQSGNFNNNTGTATPITVGTGSRWLVYVKNLSKNIRNGLMPDSVQFGKTMSAYGPGTITSLTTNQFIYSDTQVASGAALTVTADNYTRTYGGSGAPPLTYTVTGFQGNDTLANSVTGAASIAVSGTFNASTAAGTYTGVLQTSLGTMASILGYTFTLVNGNFIINPAQLTVTATAKNKTYGASDPALTYTYTGLVNSDSTTTFSGALSRATGENATTYTIGQNTLASSNGNYTIGTYNAGTFTIDPAQLTVTAAAKSKTYGGSDPALTYTYTGLVNSDSSTTFSGALSRATGENATTYTIGQNTLASSNGNYTIGTFNAGTFTINPALLTVTATAKNKTYGGSDPALTYTYSGLVNSDSTTTFSGALARVAGSNTGTYAINQGTLASSNGNYTIGTYNAGTFTIDPAQLTVTAAAKSKTYGGTDPALTYTYTGLVNGDSTTTFSGALSRATGENATTYAINQGTLASSNSNYTIGTYNAGTFTIDPAQLTVTAAAKSKTYGGSDPALTYTYTGLVNGDSTTTFSGALSRATGENATTYAINQGTLASSNSNYTIGTYNAGTFTIDPAQLTVTAAAKSKTYGGSDPALTYSYTGLVNSDSSTTFSGALTRVAGSNAGTYAINQGTLASSNGNYTIGTYNAGTFTIDPAQLTVTADHKDKQEGDADPALTYTYSGLVNGDSTASFTGALARNAGETVGNYAINRNTLDATGNYRVGTYTADNLAIAAASSSSGGGSSSGGSSSSSSSSSSGGSSSSSSGGSTSSSSSSGGSTSSSSSSSGGSTSSSSSSSGGSTSSSSSSGGSSSGSSSSSSGGAPSYDSSLPNTVTHALNPLADTFRENELMAHAYTSGPINVMISITPLSMNDEDEDDKPHWTQNGTNLSISPSLAAALREETGTGAKAE